MSTVSSPWKITGSLVVADNKDGERTFYQSFINYMVPEDTIFELPTITDEEHTWLEAARIEAARIDAEADASRIEAASKQESRKRSGRSGGNASRTSRKR